MLNYIYQSLDYIRRHYPYTIIGINGDFDKMKESHLTRNQSMKQIVDLPIRGNAIQDKIHTNIPNFYQRPVMCAQIDLSDHKVVVCIPSTLSNYTPSRSYKTRDRARFMAALRTTSWETIVLLKSQWISSILL